MIKKRVALVAALLIIPSVYAITPESILQVYLDFYGWFDFLIYLFIFTGAAKFSLESVFKKTGEESKSISFLYMGIGLLLALSLVTWEMKSEFYLYQLGPIVIAVFLLLIIAWIWKLLKSKKAGEKKETRSALRFLAIFILILIATAYLLFPNLLYYYFWASWIGEVLAIIMIICILVILFSFKPAEEKEGIKGKSWRDRRREKKEEKKRLAEEIAKQREGELKTKETKKEVEIERKRKEREAELARIEAIGKIICYIHVYSNIEKNVLVHGDEVLINDKLKFDARTENSSGNIKYTWKIGKEKFEKRTVELYAARLGKGKNKISLFVKDDITGYKSSDHILLNIVSQKKGIPQKPLREKIIEKITTAVKKGPLRAGINAIYTKKGEISSQPLQWNGLVKQGDTIEVEIKFIGEEPKSYKAEFKIFGISYKNKKYVKFNTEPITSPGKKIIKVKVKDLETGQTSKSNLKFNFVVPGKIAVGPKIKGAIAQAPSAMPKLKPSNIKNWLGHRKRNTKKILRIFESLKIPFETQKSNIEITYKDIEKTLPPNIRVRFGVDQEIIRLLNETKTLEITIQKSQDLLYKKLSMLIKNQPDDKIRNMGLALRSQSEALRFQQIDRILRMNIQKLIELITESINDNKLKRAYAGLKRLKNVLEYRTEKIDVSIKNAKTLVSYLETK